MARHDPKIDEKLSSKGWGTMRPVFTQLHESLLAANESVASKAETIYIKYQLVDDVFGSVFAVIWIRPQDPLTVGLALPDNFQHPLLGSAPPKRSYPPLSHYAVIGSGDTVPREFAKWASKAYNHVKQLKAETG